MQDRRYFLAATLGVLLVASAASCAKSDDSVSGAAGSGGADAGSDTSATGATGGTTGTGGTPAGGGSSGTGGAQNGGGSGGAAGAQDGGGAGGTGGSVSDGSAGDSGNTCTLASDCPPGSNDCVTATCTAGSCGTTNTAAGTLTATQTAGDCKKNICDGLGGSLSSNDNADLPDDNNPCTTDGCSNGIPTHAPLPAGTSCGTGLVCTSAGTCAGCAVPSDCPGQDTQCATRTCTAGVCGTSFAAAGTKLGAQTAGDCKVQQCDGSGNVATVSDNTDVPVDGKQCTSDVCSSGVPSNPPSPAGTSCSENGGTACNGAGTCVGCLSAASCPGTDTDCSKRTCTNNVCGTSNTAAGTPTSSQTTGDCKTSVCDGAGGITYSVNNADVPVDGLECTGDVCSSGTPTNPPLVAGTSCSQNGGKLCNGSGSCVQCLIGSDCPSGICQSNTCGSVVCGTGTVDCDGQSSNGCECAGTSCCGTACSPQHQNGLGQTYSDCSPLGVPGNAATYSIAMASEARAAWPLSGTDGNAKCTGPGSPQVVFRQTATSCAVWAYTGSIAGYVNLNSASNTCYCPAAGGTSWN